MHYYQHALDLITDVFDLDCEDDMRETIEKSARHLYGLVHARYIVTTRGLAKMVRPFPTPPILSPKENKKRLTQLPGTRRSTSSKKQTSANAHACCATHSRSSPWA